MKAELKQIGYKPETYGHRVNQRKQMQKTGFSLKMLIVFICIGMLDHLLSLISRLVIFLLLLSLLFVAGCGDGRGVSELIGAREAIIEEYPIARDAEDCITEIPQIYTSLGEVVVTFDLDCLLEVERGITGYPVDMFHSRLTENINDYETIGEWITGLAGRTDKVIFEPGQKHDIPQFPMVCLYVSKIQYGLETYDIYYFVPPGKFNAAQRTPINIRFKSYYSEYLKDKKIVLIFDIN